MVKQEERKEATRCLHSYRFWHQERRAHQFHAGELERQDLLERAARFQGFADEASEKLERARVRYIELTGVEPSLW